MGNEHGAYTRDSDSDDSELHYHNHYDSDSDSDMDLYDHHHHYEPPRKLQKTTDDGQIEIKKPPPGLNGLMPYLTIDLIRQYCSAATFEEAYLAIVEKTLLPTNRDIIKLEGLQLTYDSQESAGRAKIHLRAMLNGIDRAECSCIARGPLWCRHIVQALLVVLYDPDRVIRNEVLTKAMEVADKVVLQDLLMQHIEAHPEFGVTLFKALKEQFPGVFRIEPPKEGEIAVPPPLLVMEESTSDPMKVILKPIRRSSLGSTPMSTGGSSATAHSDWRPDFLLHPDKFTERSESNPKLDAKKFGSTMREFATDYGPRSYYGPGSSCPHQCYTYQMHGSCSHSTGSTKPSNAPQMNELFETVELLWENGDILNALEAMVAMTNGLSEATHRINVGHGLRPMGLYSIATRLGEKWCRVILSCPLTLLEQAPVRDAIENYVLHIRERSDPTEPIFRGALLCLQNHWSDPALVKLLDAAFGKDAPAASDAMDVDAKEPEVSKPATRSTKAPKSKKRKRGGDVESIDDSHETPLKGSSSASLSSVGVYDEPLVAVAARLGFFAEVGNRTAWNALARWVIASIGGGKSAPSVQDCKIIADALVTHSALGALAFLSGPVRKYSTYSSESNYLTFNEISEICELLVNVAGKCCTPELKDRRSAPLSSLVVRCATLVAPHLWDSLEDPDQVTNLLDYPPEITDLVTLELAIQAISSLAGCRGDFAIAHMIWKLLPRIEKQCDIIAAADAALAAFPFSVVDAVNSGVPTPSEVRGRSLPNWNKECCMTLIDYCYSRLPVTKRRSALTKALDSMMASKRLSITEVHGVLRRLIEIYKDLSDTPVVTLDLTEETKKPEPPKKSSSRQSAAAAAAAASASTSTGVEPSSSSLEVYMCDLIWKFAASGFSRKAPPTSRSSSYYYDSVPSESDSKLKTDFFNDVLKFYKTIPKLRLAQTSIAKDEKALLREIGKIALESNCDDMGEILLTIASTLPVEEPDTIRMAAKSFEMSAKLSARQSSERRYVGGAMQQEYEETAAKQVQYEALRWLEKAVKLPPKDRDPDLFVSLLKGVYSIVPDVETFDKIDSLMSPETLNKLKLTPEHKRAVRQSLIETLKVALDSNSQVKCERAAVMCVHLGLFPDSVAPPPVPMPYHSHGYGHKTDLVSVLPKLIDHIAGKGKNMYWFDLLIERLLSNSETPTPHGRLLNASKILLEKGRWDLSVKIQGEAILGQARLLSSSSSDYTKFVDQLNQYKNSCIDANAVDRFQEVFQAVMTTSNIARKPKLVGMLGGINANIKGASNTKAKNALEKSIKAAKEKVAKGADAKLCGSCLTPISNTQGLQVVVCSKCSKANCMLVD